MSYYATTKSPEPAGHFIECTTCGASGENAKIEGEMPDRVEYAKSRAITAWNTRPPAIGVELRRHFKQMQRMATAYLVPEDYKDRNGRVTLQGDHNNTDQWKQGQRGFRAEAFANDMIYMLDGPEERAALSATEREMADLRQRVKLAIVANVSISEGRFWGIDGAIDAILAALPSVPVGGLGASAAPIPTEFAGVVWHPMSVTPAAPCMAVMAIISDETAHLANIAPGRDERYELGWWTGSEWCESGSAHAYCERLYPEPDFYPTHWSLVLPPSPASVSPGTDDAPCVGSEPSLPTEDAAGGWQDISTAPKDSTEVIVLCGRKVIRLGWYFKPSSRSEGWLDESGRAIKPTHWMPLPAAPTTPASLDGGE